MTAKRGISAATQAGVGPARAVTYSKARGEWYVSAMPRRNMDGLGSNTGAKRP